MALSSTALSWSLQLVELTLWVVVDAGKDPLL
jgi:hypothetical protein